MRPFNEYPTLTINDLQIELANTVKLRYNTYGEYAKALGDYEREHIIAYYNSPDDSHAAKTRFADQQTYTLHDDVITFEQQLAAFTVLYDYLTNLINWKISGSE